MDKIVKDENFAKVTEILLKLGLQPKMKGFEYLRSAVLIQFSCRKGHLLEIYKKVGEMYNAKSESVEKGIRSAVKYAYDIGGLLSVNEYYGKVIYTNKKKFTNLELISIICEIVNLQNN